MHRSLPFRVGLSNFKLRSAALSREHPRTVNHRGDSHGDSRSSMLNGDSLSFGIGIGVALSFFLA